MEQNFQTSFIPKKPMVQDRAPVARSVGLFTILPIFILFTALLGTAGLYFYRGVLTKNIADMENTLNLARNRFEPSRITELQVLDKRLRASTEILGKHIVATPVFEALSAITMQTVRYTKFSYSFEDESSTANTGNINAGNNIRQDPRVIIKMSGVAVGYRSIALQSDLFTTRDEGKNFINPVFSNLTLNNNGNVVFDLEFSVEPSFVNYKQTLLTESSS